MALAHVDPRQVAAVVTHLEMRERPKPAPLPPSTLRLVRWKAPSVEKYRLLFRRVGEPWLWFSRLLMADDALAAIIHDPAVEIHAVTDVRGIEIGILELDFRSLPDCELAFFGLVPQLAGQGHGRWLMGQAKMLAWRKGVERFWVHTCTLDHPAALQFYIKSGFVPFGRAIETFDDPRMHGVLPREAAPHVPLLA
ncbi:GNAT family N-acetyltransferase [Sphingobium algorifonticola]|uniref:GNAT family N-acetyltransferase n=1 Tax=Sphingobium algorifonticola TaxID=2008318 RepID=A0A437JBQ8_9SPHN|nr:GNAT family N-acetyltransferase [Sphingobium algorifonticola]RVT43311.1 GNAT family N-acetyltransferase [Sphingobium algorifonticola]